MTNKNAFYVSSMLIVPVFFVLFYAVRAPIDSAASR
jgi:hypothetical protein